MFHEPWHRLREHSPFHATRYAALQHDKDDKLLDHYGMPFHFELYDYWPDQDWLVGALASLGLRFPIRHMTKAALLADATRRGFAHVLDLTWSCEADGSSRTQPCGTCTPCRLRIVGATGRA